MSRIGKKTILIPEQVTISINDGEILVKGPKGELKTNIPDQIIVEIKDNQIIVSIKKEQDKALWGLYRSLIFNMVEGITKGYEKRLVIQGVGYTAALQDKGILLKVGFSHPVTIDEVPGINFTIDKNVIIISGIDKQLVGQVAANIRKVKPPEPYKGKGIRYEGEKVRRKEGKKAVTAG
jgi:large subunit ribosomal protein L6